MDRRRLERLVEQGDREAARALWNEARRRADRTLAVRAAAALDDAEALVELVLEAWAAKAWAAVEDAGAALGLVLDAPTCGAIDALRERAHGRRRLRLLSRDDVLRTLVSARLARSYATGHGGKPPSRGETTVALAIVRDDGVCVLGVARASGTTPSDVEGWGEGLGAWAQANKHERCVRWAWGAPAPERLIIELVPTATDARRLGRDAAPCERVLARLSAVEADDEVYRALVELLESWPRGAEREDAERVAEEALAGLALERRSLLEDEPTLGLFKPTPTLHPLQAHLRIELPADLPALAELDRLDGIRSVEIVERSGRNAAGQPEALRALLERSALVDSLERLSLRVSSAAVLMAVARCPRLLSQLRTLVVTCAEPLDLTRAKLYATIFESCTSLERLELVHRSRLSAMIPALKRVRRVAHLRLALGRVSYVRLEQALSNLRRAAPTSLDLLGTDLRGGALAVVAQAPALAGLERLSLVSCHLGADAIETLAGARCAETLRALDLSGNALGPEADLAPLHVLGALRELALGGCGLDTASLATLFSGAPWQLERLDLRRNPLGAEAGALLAGASCLESLRRLNLAVTEIDEGAREIFGAPWMRTLRSLVLRRARRGEAWLEALGTVSPAQLEHLDLGRCELGWRGVEALRAVPGLQLRTLRLDHNPLGARGLRLLATWQGLASVTRLDLNQTRAGSAGRSVLADSPWLRGLVAGIEGIEGSLRWRR